VVPQYAVPLTDLAAELIPAGPADGDRHGPGRVPLGPSGQTVLTPSTGFGVHSTDGTTHTLRLGDAERPAAAFRPSDPALADHVIVDFTAFDTWLEEDEEIVSHPRDPFHRVDVRRSSRNVCLELDGRVLAESSRPSLLFETNLPVRYYVPESDVDKAVLEESETATACAYKGVARYWSLVLPDRTEPDLVWSYPVPLPDASQIANLLCFFTERVDLVLDGVRRPRPVSPWSPNRQG